MSLRVEFPRGDDLDGPRVFHVDDAGHETEITEVSNIEIYSQPDDLVRITVETFLHAPAEARGEGVVIKLCPHCAKEVECSSD